MASSMGLRFHADTSAPAIPPVGPTATDSDLYPKYVAGALNWYFTNENGTEVLLQGVDSSRIIATTVPLSGGGNLSANRTLSLLFDTGTLDLDGSNNLRVKTGVWQPLNTNLTSIAALTTTPFGRSLLTLADAAALTATINDATFLLPGRLTAAEKITLNSINGKTSTGTQPRVFRPGDFMIGNTFDPTGVANSTTSFQACMTAFNAFNDRAICELPPAGVFRVDPAVIAGFGSAPGMIRGGSRGACVLIPRSTGDFITLGSAVDGFAIEHFAIYNTSGTPFATGAGINTNGADSVTIENMLFVDLFYDVNVLAVAGGVNASIKVSIQKTLHSQSNGNAASVGIIVTNGLGGDTYIGPDVVMSNTGVTRRRASVEVVQSGHYEITQANLTGSAQGILVDPGAGQIVAFGFHQQVLCDSCQTNGMTLNATTATSTIKNIKSSNSWYSGTIAGGGAGLVTTGTAGGIINGVGFDGDRFLNNQTHGILHQFGTDFRWVSCDVKGNSQAAAYVSSGMSVAAGVSNWSVLGGKFGGTDTAINSTTQKYGILINAGASTDYSIIAVDLTGNGSGAGAGTAVGPYLDGGTGRRIIKDNLGTGIAPAAIVTAQAISAAATTSITNSAVFVPRGSLQTSTTWKATVTVDAATAVANTNTWKVHFGATGTSADAACLTGPANAGAAAAFTAGEIVIIFTVRTIGAAGTLLGQISSNCNSGGLSGASNDRKTARLTAAAINTQDADNFFSLSLQFAAATTTFNIQQVVWEKVW